MKLNVNDIVLVRLTDVGEAVLQKYVDRINCLTSPNISTVSGLYPENQAGQRSFELWQLMRIFGPQCTMGLPICFMDNAIELERGEL